MVLALLGYLINFLLGRSKNARLASTIYQSQRDLLNRNFSLVGDDGQTRSIQSTDDETNNESVPTDMRKESESLYTLWCSGRTSIESMLIEIRFIKRQCLFNSLAAVIKSVNDMIVYSIDYSKDDMETFVFCLAKKRCAAKLHRDMNDLSQFCLERKNVDKRGLSGNYQVLSEIGEASSAMVDSRVVDFIDKYELIFICTFHFHLSLDFPMLWNIFTSVINIQVRNLKVKINKHQPIHQIPTMHQQQQQQLVVVLHNNRMH
jgi:hypothetical protein